MSYDSSDDLFSSVLGAVENPNEGKNATKYIVSAPRVEEDEQVSTKTVVKTDDTEEKRLAEARAQKEIEDQAAERKAQEEFKKRQEEEQRIKSMKEVVLSLIDSCEFISNEILIALKTDLSNAKTQDEITLVQESTKKYEQSAKEQYELEQTRKVEEVKKQPENKNTDNYSSDEVDNLSPNEFSIATIDLVLDIADLYRSYDKEYIEVIQQFTDTADEREIIFKIINEDNSTRKALVALVRSQEAEPVDRAFFLVALENKLLHDMGSVINKYDNAEIDLSSLNSNRIEYCRELEFAINSLSDEKKDKLGAIQELYTAPISN